MLSKKVLSKCLLSAAFIFCTFTLPVFAGDSKILLLQKVTTELFYSNIPAASKHTISYNQAVYTKHTISLFFAPSQNHRCSLLLHNHLSKIKFHQALKTWSFFKTTDLFIRINTIPQNDVTDIHSAHIG